jgi:NADPH:quinone reductase-like Zn-dependent oxidoreductase
MLAVTAARFSSDNPISALELGEHAEPVPSDGWTTVTVKAASLNHHDVWTLRGVGISADRLPMILGCDAAGVDPDGNEVVVHGVVGDRASTVTDETLDPTRSLLSERYDGTFAERVAVPKRNLVPKPAGISFTDAACLPTAYLTAYRMLFDKSGLEPGSTILVQGAGGGVATALILLGRAAGYRIWVTSRNESKRERALTLGADQAFPAGQGTAPGWPNRDRGCDQRRDAGRGADQDLLPAAIRGRVDDGDARSAGEARDVLRADRGAAACRPDVAAGPGPGGILCHDKR